MFSNMSDSAKVIGGHLGFHAVGIASARGVLELADRLSPQRFHRRLDLQTALPGAESAVCVAMSYFRGKGQARGPAPTPNTQHSTLNSQRGLIARFARGLDYHEVLGSRLKTLADKLKAEFGDFRYRICVDTGPISDRACAYAVGLGSFGKNTCLITPEYGSWVVLGELVTDLDMDPDEPRELEICGDCRLCIEACPTGAIRGDFTLDRAKCLSNVTQSKKFPPPSLADKLANRVYGCDTCQEVCPLNAYAKTTDAPEFLIENSVGAHPELAMLMEMTDREYDRLFGDTAMRWVGREIIARNAASILRKSEI